MVSIRAPPSFLFFQSNFTIHRTYFYTVNHRASQNNRIFEICRRQFDYLRQKDHENQECLKRAESYLLYIEFHYRERKREFLKFPRRYIKVRGNPQQRTAAFQEIFAIQQIKNSVHFRHFSNSIHTYIHTAEETEKDIQIFKSILHNNQYNYQKY
jgi:hypothetical protein